MKLSQSVICENRTSATSERDGHFVSKETNVLIYHEHVIHVVSLILTKLNEMSSIRNYFNCDREDFTL